MTQVSTTNPNEFIKNEMELRMKLVENPDFIKQCINVAKQMGITAQEWNKNKAVILLHFANEVIGIDNKNGRKIRASLTL